MRFALAFVALVSCGARTELDAPVTDCGASLASGPSWQTPFGLARDVCLNATHPTNCPSDALLYGGGIGWNANLSTLGDASWIWRPGISTSDVSDGAEVTFTRTFVLSGVPSGTLSIAADDFAQVLVNGQTAGTIGSTTDKSVAAAAQSNATTFDLGPHLVAGANTITIVGRNGPASFSCGTTCDYAQNPAGVVFGGRLDCH